MTDDRRIFVAWSKETEAPAIRLRDLLRTRGLSAWLSDEIKPGRRFREEIREGVLSAHIVIAIFPTSPSPWQVAEAGLAYFENKLIPVCIDSDSVVEPFAELETHNLLSADLGPEGGGSIDALEAILRDRLGEDHMYRFQLGFFRRANNLFYHGTPLVGIAFVLLLIFFGTENPFDNRSVEFWLAGHTVFGAIVYGGCAFVALFFSRSGTSTSYAQRRFGFATATRLFILWFVVAVLQFFIGLAVWLNSHWPQVGLEEQAWLIASILLYPFALIFCGCGYILHGFAYRLDKGQMPLRSVQKYTFFANAAFGVAIIMLTCVIVLMSLKPEFNLD